MITIGLNMDLSGFVSGLGAARAATQAFAAVTAGIAATTAGVLKSLNKGRELAEFSEQTGITAGRIAQLSAAMDKAGMHGDDVGNVIAKMQRAIIEGGNASSGAAKAFATLGLSAQQLRGMSGDEQLVAIGRAIHGIHDPAQRTAAAMEIFGRKGSEMTRLFNDRTLDALGGKLGASAQVFNVNAGVFREASVGIEIAGKKFASMYGLFTGMAESIAPELLPMITALNSIDLTKMGQQMGRAVATLWEALKNGSLADIIGLSTELGFKRGINVLFQGLAGVEMGIASLFKNVLNVLRNFDFAATLIGASQLFVSYLGEGVNKVLNTIVGASQLFVAILARGIATAIEPLKSIPGIGESIIRGQGALELFAKRASETGKAQMAGQGPIKFIPQSFLDQAKKEGANRLKEGIDFKAFFSDILADMKRGMAEAGDAYDTSGLEKKVSGLLAANAAIADANKAATQSQYGIEAGSIGGGAITGGGNKPFDFVSSLTKIGGNLFGATSSNDVAVDVARQQLEQQRNQNTKLDAAVAALKLIAGRTGSSGVVYG